MVEKILYCPVCDYVPQKIPYEKQSRICPVCKSPCKEGDFIAAKDFEADTKAMMEDRKRDGKTFKSYNPDKKDNV